MSSTALIQSPSSKSHTISTTPSSSSRSVVPSKIAATATSVIPKLSLTPSVAAQPPKAAVPASPAVSTPGRWQHPRMEEVLKRRDRTRFDQSNVRIIGANTALIVASLIAPGTIFTYLPREARQSMQPYTSYTLYALCLYFLSNIALAVLPLFRVPDTCEDIPLTAAQRYLLGLSPMTRPATPLEEEQYITPPRYARSASTPRSSGSSSLDLRVRASPLSSDRGSPLDASLGISGDGVGGGSMMGGSGRRESGSPYSPSPLKAKVLRDGFERRRSSYGNAGASPMSLSEFDAVGANTPTKKGGVGLNNKWLYDKGRGSPGASRVVFK